MMPSCTLFPISDQHIRCRNASIVLNNTAVTLLSHGYCHEAAAILIDAVKIARFASTTNSIHSLQESLMLDKQMDCALHQSYQWIRETSNRKDRKSQSPSGPMVRAISSEYDHGSIFSMLTSVSDHRCSDDSTKSFPMKIDLIDYATCTCDDIGFEATVILYNYGISFRSCTTGSLPVGVPLMVKSGINDKTVERNAKAHHLFCMVESLLSSLDDDEYNFYNDSFSNRGLLLRTMILRALVDLSMALSWPYSKYRVALQECYDMMRVQEQCLPIVDHCIAAAA